MMADAQLMEEQLQQSVMMSERDAEYDDAPADEDIIMANEIAYSSNQELEIGSTVEAIDDDEDMGDDEHQDEDDNEGSDEGDGDEDEDDDGQQSDERSSESSGDDDDAFEEDAEGEEDDDIPPRIHVPQRRTRSVEDDQEEEEDDDEDEGVGAVKIKPGETDDEDDSDESAASSQASMSDADSEESGVWEEAVAHGGPEDEDEDEENTNGNNCIFCKQDEEHDPAEEFELFLCCSRCADNAHQQCARENDALSSQQSPENWRCPDCVGEDSDAGEVPDEDGSVNGVLDVDVSPASRRSTAPKLARDLLPPQKGSIKPDSHTVFDKLVLNEDPLDGSRVLRKRKTSSAEADDNAMALRKRRRNTADESIDGTDDLDESARPVSARSLRLKTTQHAATILKKTRDSVVVQMRVSAAELRDITSRKPRARGDRKRSRKTPGGRSSRGRNDRSRNNAAAAAALATAVTPFTTTSYTQPFYSFYDRETDELKGKPYGGILTETEADTSKTLPTNDDRRRFDEAKQKAEEEWRQRLLKMQAEIEAPAKRSKKASGPASQIECIEFGGWEIDTWYAAPYPEEYSRNRVLYICEFCLKYMNSDYVAWRHKLKCPAKHPPGDEIYRHGSVSVFEVDGRKNPVYCQNLCLLAKLFLGSKTLYYDVEPFLFYVLCEYDDLGYHFVGYFSKEKRASSQNNVSCILTLPIHQRKGYGNLLIDFSYLLTRVEQKTGSPEKPLSDMGLVSYRNYWRLIMCKYLLEYFSYTSGERKGLSIKTISDDTGLTPDDVISALEGLRCLVRDPQTQVYAFRVDQQYCREYIAKWESKNYVQLNPSALTWTPYVMGRSNATNFELGPALTAIAPREDADEPKTAVSVGDSLVNGTATLSQPEPANHEPKIDGEKVLESTETEPNGTELAEDSVVISKTETKPNGILVNGDSANHDPPPELELQPNSEPEPEAKVESKDIPGDWRSQYKDIPPTRFEVVPPLAGTRRADRVRLTVPRPPAVRTASSASRPRPKRPAGSSRRTTSSSKPKSASKRKTGGTGRGPGRWPKGTKKSDYGNADSGPGLPPGWTAGGKATPVQGDKKGGKDTVEVQTPGVKETKSQRRSESASTKRNGSIGGTSTASKGRPSPRSQSSSSKSNNSRDIVMGDDHDEDAEGDEEEDDDE